MTEAIDPLPAVGNQNAFNAAGWDKLMADPQRAATNCRVDTDRFGRILMARPLGLVHRLSQMATVVLGFLLLSLPIDGWAHGSEYVYARLVLGSKPRLEVSLEYRDNPLVDSKEQARGILERELIVRAAGHESDLGSFNGKLAPNPAVVWGEATTFPRSAPVPVPEPGDGTEHRLITASLEVAENFELSVKASSEQAVIYWIDDGQPGPPKWTILLAGDTSPALRVPGS